MKFLFCVVLIAFVAAAQAELTEEQKAKLKQHIEQCTKQFPVEAKLLDRARKGDVADNKNLKDYILCVTEKSGFINAEGKIQANVLETKLASVVNSENAKKLVAKCTSQKNLDKRETALEIYKCIYNETQFSLI